MITKSECKSICKTLNNMFDKFEDYKYAENGFEDTKEYNELKSILIKLENKLENNK